MLEIYADGALIYDSRVPDVALQELKVTRGLNKGGTATITVPPGHPHFSSISSYRSEISIHRDGRRLFRGRSLYPTDTFDLLRTFTCEGERCFLQDAVIRGPYVFQDRPDAIFRDVIDEYNAQVDPFKQFVVGTVDVTDPNDYIRLENGETESAAVVVDKLVDRCGGYITFTDTEDGKRAIHWLAQLTRQSTQDIAFGDNLLDFSRTTANTDLATVIVPYGAVKNEETGERYDIKAVNGGLDYIEAPEAVLQLRGRIVRSVVWDDVTQPANLLAKARAYLAEKQQMLTTLTLTALDLSIIDKTVDSFELGDLIKVYSKPHGIDGETYQLTEMTLDLLHPENDKITLGKTVASLTGADVVITQMASSRLQQVSLVARKSYTLNEAKLSQVEQTLRSEITQLADSITLEVSGSIGGTASIKLNVNGAAVAQSLDLSGVRQAFANDTSAVTISAGTITFNSGTLIVNSGNFQLTADGTITAKAGTIGGWTIVGTKLYAGDGETVKVVAIQAPSANITNVFAAGGTDHSDYSDCPFRVTKAGKLYATDAVIRGDVVTIDGSFKTQLDRGSLKLYYSDALCGTINTKYWSGASTEGISLRIEEAGSYIMFSHPSSAGTGYDVDYYLNYGWSSSYDEKHIFQTSARFLDAVYFQRAYHRALYLQTGDGTYLVGVNSSGQLTCSKV